MSKLDDRGHSLCCERGKSELQRAGCWVIPSGGDSKESATERYRPFNIKGLTTLYIEWVRVERWGKSLPATRWL